MKKVLILMVSLTLLLSTIPALGEEIDLVSMSTDELIALRISVNNELDARLVSNSTYIFGGVYTVGVNVKAGKYAFIVGSAPAKYAQVNLYENSDARDNYESVDCGGDSLHVGDSLYLDLKDGMILVIENGSGSLNLVDSTWAP